METIAFPYVQQGQAKRLDVVVSEGLVVVTPIIEALGLRLKTQQQTLKDSHGAQQVKVTRAKAWAVTVVELETWLRALPLSRSKVADPELLKHFTDNLRPAIEHQSVGLKAASALAHVELVKAKERVTLLTEPLDGLDIARRALVRGGVQNWLPAAMIDGAVRRGKLDTFLLVDNIWEDRKEVHHTVMRLSRSGFDEKTFALRRKVGEILTGPELEQIDPGSRFLKHRIMPAHKTVIPLPDDPDTGRLVDVPEAPIPFSWEIDLGITPKGE